MTETIDLAAFNRLYPGQIVLSDDSRRLDGRADGKARELSLNLDTLRSTNGSCMCKLGGTVVMAGVRAKLSKVTHGELSLTLDVASFALSQMKQGQAAEIQATLSERLHGLLVGANGTSSDAFSQPPPLNSKGCLDLEKLSVAQGKASWHLSLDILILNIDGSVLDACLLAAMASLLSTILPSVTTNAQGEVVKASDLALCGREESDRSVKRRKVDGEGKVEMRHLPLSVTLALYSKDGRVLLDPSGEEEAMSGCVVTVVVDEASDLHGLFLPGGSHAVGQDRLLQCIESAKIRRREMDALLKEAIAI